MLFLTSEKRDYFKFINHILKKGGEVIFEGFCSKF